MNSEACFSLLLLLLLPAFISSAVIYAVMHESLLFCLPHYPPCFVAWGGLWCYESLVVIRAPDLQSVRITSSIQPGAGEITSGLSKILTCLCVHRELIWLLICQSDSEPHTASCWGFSPISSWARKVKFKCPLFQDICHNWICSMFL